MVRNGLDFFDLEAMREVDELTPSTPPIYPGHVGFKPGESVKDSSVHHPETERWMSPSRKRRMKRGS